eukprot:633659-Lingulodinium_polyedra.AAC.1
MAPARASADPLRLLMACNSSATAHKAKMDFASSYNLPLGTITVAMKQRRIGRIMIISDAVALKD